MSFSSWFETVTSRSRSREARSRRRYARPRMEILEDRTLLSNTPAHVFARFEGVLDSPTDTERVSIRITPDDFTLAGRHTLLGFHLKAGAGSGLDPAALKIRDAYGTLIQPLVVNAGLAGNTQSLVVADLSSGSYQLTVRGEGQTAGAFQLDVFLGGDVNGDGAVTRQDVRELKDLQGSCAGDGRYRVEADLNLDGRITGFDYAQGKRNVGDATRLRPLSLALGLSPDPVRLPDGRLVTRVQRPDVVGTTNPGAHVRLETDGDGLFDEGSTKAGPSGRYSLVTSLAEGANTVQALARDGFGQRRTASILVTLDTLPPVIEAQLLRDTAPGGGTNSDGLTTDPAIAGSVRDVTTPVVGLRAGFDSTPPESFIDVFADLQSDGSFTLSRARLEEINGGALADGPHTLHLRATDAAGNTSVFDVSFTLDTQPPAVTSAPTGTFPVTFGYFDVSFSEPMADSAFAVANYSLTVEDGVNAGQVISLAFVGRGADSRTARIYPGTPLIWVGTSLPNTSVGQSADSQAARINLWTPLLNGNYVLTIGSAVSDPAGNPLAEPRTFRFTVDGDQEPPLIAAALAHDTAPGGQTNDDGITSDPAVAGTVTDASAIGSFSAFFEYKRPHVPVYFGFDVLADLQPDGSFAFDRARLEEINGGPLADGQHTLELRAVDARLNGSIFHLDFTLDTQAPQTDLALSLTSDSGVIGDGITSARRVTLVGHSEGDSRITIQETGTSVLASRAGTFQVPGVTLTPGANTFTYTATDVAGNSTQKVLVIQQVDEVASPDEVLHWNQVALAAVQLDAAAPPLASRNLAMVSLAIFDAINVIEGTPSYAVAIPAPAGASAQAAVAAAAHRVLSYLFPAQQAAFAAELAAALTAVPDGAGEADGVALGQAIGDAIIALRADDGSRDFLDHFSGSAPGEWQATPPMFDVALLPQWASLRPFAMTSPDQFRPDGPPPLNSPEYAAAFNEVKDLGRADSSTRTAEQTQIARFWADGLGTATPPGHWNQIAARIAQAQGNSLADNARLFAMLNVALADAGIAAWDAKYHFDTWRPVTAIRAADGDGNPGTAGEATWTPLLVTPPFPEYTSGHSTFSAAAATVLTAFFGDLGFDDTVTLASGVTVTRHFSRFQHAAEEAGQSRIYGGIHFQFANQDGQAAGTELAKFVLQRFSNSADETGPSIVVHTPANPTVSTDLQLQGQVLDDLSGVASLEAATDGNSFQPVAFDATGRFLVTASFALDGSADGHHVIVLQARDFAGNVSGLVEVSFTLDTQAPALNLSSPLANNDLTAGTRLTGTADGTGSSITQLTYAFDDGEPVPVSFASATGAFAQVLDLSGLAVGPHVLTITARDAAGFTSSVNLDVNLPALIPFTITSITPHAGADEVGSTFRPQVFFSRPVDPTSLSSDNFFATDTTGAKLAATIVPANDGSFAWLFFDAPMPGASRITVTVDGTSIRAEGGTLLDADGDGAPGGVLRSAFTTVNLAPVPLTRLVGVVADPGPDRKPGSFDDVRPGPDGVLMTGDDVYLFPLAGVRVFVLGMEDTVVVTGPDGRFDLRPIPTGNVKLVVDGMTATNAPAGVYFPEMVMDLRVRPGATQTVMAAMEPDPVEAAEMTSRGVYLPRLQTSILQDVSNGAGITIGVDATSAPELTPEQRQLLSIEVQPGSLIGHDGQPVANGQVGISTVPPELVREMLPAGLLQHTFDITVQAPGISNFATPAPMTFPNVFNAAPGTQLNFLSFDHTTGRLVIEGTGTVSADGLSVRTDPGTGITHPGWHGMTPPGGCGGSGGAPPLPNPAPLPAPPRVEDPVVLALISGEPGLIPTEGFPELKWTAPLGVPEPIPRGCFVPSHDPQGLPSLEVSIEIDGPISDFLKPTGSLAFTPLRFTLLAGSGVEETLAGQVKTYDEMLVPGGFRSLIRDRLYGTRVTVTETLHAADGTDETTIKTYLIYRWVDVVDAEEADDHEGTTAAFFRTNTQGVIREKNIDTFLPTSVRTFFDGSDTEFTFPDAAGASVTWTWDPSSAGPKTRDVPIRAEFDVAGTPFTETVGQLTAKGTATAPTTIAIDLAGYQNELQRVLGQLVGFPGDPNVPVNSPFNDGQPGIAGVNDDGLGPTDDVLELGWPGSDDVVQYDFGTDLLGRSRGTIIASAQFQTLFRDVLPWKSSRPTFAADLAAVLNTQAAELLAAVRSDFAVANTMVTTGYVIDPGTAGDVTMGWEDLFIGTFNSEPVFGIAQGDRDRSFLEDLIANSNTDVGLAAKQWALAEGINRNVTNSGKFAVAINIDWTGPISSTTPPPTFAQYVANTVSHEIAHTFGLVDAYRLRGQPNGGTAGCLGGNCIPFDIMRLGVPGDPDLTFGGQNPLLLQAALGMQANGDTPLRAALFQYQNTFNLPGDVNGLRLRLPPGEEHPAVALERDGVAFFGGETDSASAIAADGPAGTASTLTYVVRNVGLAPLVLDAVTLADGSRGFALVETGVVGQTLGPGEGGTLTVRFDPPTRGTFDDTLTLAGNAGTFVLHLRGSAFPQAPTVQAAVGVTNNLGGVAVAGPAAELPELATVSNEGTEPLLIHAVRMAEGAAFSLVGVPDDLASHPISLGRGEGFTFGIRFDPDRPGLSRARVEVVTNDPDRPVLHLGAVGTGLGEIVYPAWGRDWVALETPRLPNSPTLRTLSDGAGHFELFLPPEQAYHSALFDPETGLVAHGYGFTPPSGRGTDLTASLVFGPSTAPDRDFDGLPDDVEFAVGTSTARADSDNDGLDDFAELQQGLDPLSGRLFSTGVLASVRLDGVVPLDLAVTEDTAFVANDRVVALVDVSRPEQPRLLSQLSFWPFATIAVTADPRLDVAVAATGDGTLHLIDVSAPTRPVVRQTIAFPEQIFDLEAVGGVVYVSSRRGLDAIDLRTGALLDTLPVETGRLARDGDMLYTLATTPNFSQRFVAVSLAQPTALRLIASLNLPADVLPSGSSSIFAGGGVVYLAHGPFGSDPANHGLVTIDVSDPSAPVLISGRDGVFSIPSLVANGSGQAVAVLFSPDITTSYDVGVLDVTDPQVTDAVRYILPTPGFATQVALASGLAFVLEDSRVNDSNNFLTVVNYLPIDVQGQAPTVAISTSMEDLDPLTDGLQVVEGSGIPVRIEAADDVQVQRVEVLVNGEVVSTDVAFPWDVRVIATGTASPSGTMTIQVRATDSGGNTGLSELLLLDVRPDTLPPSIEGVVQTEGASGLLSVGVLFSESMAAATLTPQTVRLRHRDGVEVVPQSIQMLKYDRLVRLTLDSLPLGTYELVIDAAAITDQAGNPLGTGVPVLDVVANGLAPSILTVEPCDGGIHAEGLETVQIRFSEPMALSTLTTPVTQTTPTLQVRRSDGTLLELRNLQTSEGDRLVQLTFDPLPPGTYELVIDAAGLTDRAGDPLGATQLVSRFRVVDRFQFEKLFPDRDFLTGENPQDIAAGDVNGDGNVDLVTLNREAPDHGTVSVLLGRGDGTFAAPCHYPAADRTTSALQGDVVVLGDVDGDGDLDIVTANDVPGGASASVFLGFGDGTFAPRTDYEVAPQAYADVALGDVNRDGRLDIVTAGDNGGSVLRGDGAGGFGGRSDFSTEDAFCTSLADVNNDGDLDLLLSHLDSFSVLLGNGNGTFASPTTYVVNTTFLPGYAFLDTADLDDDGDLDVVALAGNRASVWFGQGDGSFAFRTAYEVRDGLDPVVTLNLADLTGDGRPDLIVRRQQTLAVLPGASNGTFGSMTTYPSRIDLRRSALLPRGLAIADYDSDGNLDLALPEARGYVAVMLGNGNEPFPIETDYSAGPNRGSYDVALGDVNGDGTLDLLTGVTGAGAENNGVSVRLGNGDGTYADSSFVGVHFLVNGELALGDLNHDGALDLVDGPSVLLGDGLGGFGTPTTLEDHGFASRPPVALGDLNRDGHLDLVLGTSAAQVAVYLGDGNGSFQTPIVLTAVTTGDATLDRIEDVVLGDVDGDGDLDIVTANLDAAGFNEPATLSDSFSIFFADSTAAGDLIFSRADFLDYRFGFIFNKVALGDMDTDGDLDLVVSYLDDLAHVGGVSVRLSDGEGGFESPLDIALGDVALSLSALDLGDLNGDGNLDVVGMSDHSVAMLFGTGDGAFGSRHNYLVGGSLQDVVLGDLDNDGDLDFVSTAGGLTSPRLNPLVGGDPTPPSVTVATTASDVAPSTPGLQVVEGALLPLSARAALNAAVANVDLLVNGQVVPKDLFHPLRLSTVAPNLTAGSDTITFQARATDINGVTTVSDLLVIAIVPDTFPPSIVNITPADGAMRLEGPLTVRVRFSEPLAEATVTTATFQLREADGDAVTPSSLQLGSGGQLVQISYPFVPAGNYQLVISAPAVTDRVGNPLATTAVVSELTLTHRAVPTTTVADADPNTPELEVVENTTVPLGVSVDDSVQVQNVELLVNGVPAGSDTVAPFEFIITAPSITPQTNSLTLQVRVTDTAGITTVTNTLVIGLVDDVTPPSMVGVTPADGAEVASGLGVVEVRFSEALEPAGVTDANFQLFEAGPGGVFDDGDDILVPLASLQVRDGARTVGLTTQDALAAGNYQLRVLENGVADLAGNLLGTGTFRSGFRVVQQQSNVFSDPQGDTFGTGAVQLDIASVSGRVEGGNLVLTMTFFSPIAPPNFPFPPESVVGYWDLDLDQNPATGTASHQSTLVPTAQQGGPLGVDAYVDLAGGIEARGFVSLYIGPTLRGFVPIAFTATSFQITIPLDTLGDDGTLHYGTVIGTFSEWTDAAPNDVVGAVNTGVSS